MRHTIDDFAYFQQVQKKDLAKAFGESKQNFNNFRFKRGYIELRGKDLALFINDDDWPHALTPADQFTFAKPELL